MPSYTEHYNLIKPNKTENYNIDVANTNNEVIDEELYKKVEKIPGKELSTNDFTNAYKQMLDNLKIPTNNNELENGAGYQNAEQVWETIQLSHMEINKILQILQEGASRDEKELFEIKTFIENSMKTLLEEGTSIHVSDSADYPCTLEIEGKSEQVQTENSPSPEYPSEIENVSGDLEVKVLKQNLFMKQGLSTSVDTENFWSNFAYTTPLEDGWCKVEVNNTGTTSAMYANQMIKRGNIDKIKADTNYIIWAEFRNIETNNAGNYANLCGSENISIWTGNVAVPLNAQNKKIIQKVKTKTDISNATLDLRNFVSVINNSYVTLEYRMMILEDIYTDEELQKITYEDYNSQTVTFPFSEGQKLYKDGYLASDGIHNKRTQIILTGNEGWIISSIQDTNYGTRFDTTIPGAKPTVNYIALSNFFKHIGVNKGGIWVNTGSVLAVRIQTPNFNTVEELKTWLAEQYANGTPVIVEYEMQEEITPYTEEQQTAYEQLQKLKTYRTVTNVSNSQNTNMVLTYKKDLQTQFQELETMLLESGV